ncbi:MAG: glycine--tRNA ligase [Candidatus Komeilibacteria bacterium CG_4_10_14_0_2_um_filter_37_10]|uniref:Glycine--tRNA ligase n=1 Tax=Candidatus Komeilibacteria bacterium CG_4_10_14_0_2_um_filter_37_10 TaxID=1974470 RepID=A0A2M7VFE7_9BACT|nr:MAG: glycine--tRNA ligase [Candidatus Komeilibacteria bacterium CG_4_10_14_0_2_um_filter_37_10]
MEKVVALAKRRGFIFPSSEIYGGLSAAYDYGPLGIELKNNIKKAWWKKFVQQRPDMFGLDAAIIMHPKVWEASGHIANFSDPLVDCKKCRRRFRADHLLAPSALSPQYDKEKRIDLVDLRCPDCGGELTDQRQFNLMFKTFMGPVTEEASAVYLRPETAGGIFTNFKSITETMRARLPFGIAQIGKAFRNEITTENFIFRTREFEQMEIEYFVHESEWHKYFSEWQIQMREWCQLLGIRKENLIEHEIPDGERAFYSKRTIDFEYQYPFGQKELYGLAYRTDYDLHQQQKYSGQDLTYTDPITKEKFLPHVIEPSLGVDRSFLACLLEAYTEIDGGRSTTTEAIKDMEVVLKLPYVLAPIKIAILPLSKKEKLINIAREIQSNLNKNYFVQYDETGSIGKRYRRQDEIGTPYCLTIDFETVEDMAVTVRDRDSMQQERIAISELSEYFACKLKDN